MRYEVAEHRLLGKCRTRGHVIADLAVNHVERMVLLAGHIAERQWHDYGIDLLMRTFNHRGEIEAGSVYFQVKATSRLRLSADRSGFSFTLNTADLLWWGNESTPVIVVVYDATRDVAYWHHLGSDVIRRLRSRLRIGQRSVNLKFDLGNRFDRDAVKYLRRLRHLLLRDLPHGTRHHL